MKAEIRNQKPEDNSACFPALLISAFYFLLSIILSASPSLGQNQTSEEAGLTPVNFRAPEFPRLPAYNPASSAPSGPPVPGRAGLGLPSPAEDNQAASPADDNQVASLWISSPPLTMGGLRGKVVLIDFWEYSCINCIRTFAKNKEWYARYHKYGFELVGVHDFEFDIASHFPNVQAAVKRFGLNYPIFVDANFQLWQAYHNNSWPSLFLIDATGVVRFHKDGEGNDDALEHAIQRLLLEAHPGLKFPSDYTIAPEPSAFASPCGIPTPEMYVGDWSGRGILSNREGYHDGRTIHYELPANIDDGQAAVSGPWQTDKNGMIYRGKNGGARGSSDKLVMRYHARELYAVMNVSHGHPSALYIQQDGKDLTAADKGVDVSFDAQGHSYIEVREPRMYYLVQNPAFGAHTVTLAPTKPGLTINSFTFGNDCQTKFSHL